MRHFYIKVSVRPVPGLDHSALYPGQSALFEVAVENNSPYLDDGALAYSVRSDDGRDAFADTMILVSRYTIQPWEYNYFEAVGARDAQGARKVGRTFLVELTEPTLTRGRAVQG